MNDSEIARLASLTQLRELDISGTAVTDTGFQQLSLPQLHTLAANGCMGMTDDSIDSFIRIESLSRISLVNVHISLDAMERLRLQRSDLMILANPVMFWEFIDRPELRPAPVFWITEQTDLDELFRYFRLPHDWETGKFDDQTQTTRLTLGGSGVGNALPEILAGFPVLESLTLVDATTDGGFDRAPRSLKELTLLQLRTGS